MSAIFTKYRLEFVIAAILLVFGLLADEVVEGDTLAFDRAVLMLFRSAADPQIPIGPLWLQEAVRDITSLGSVSILTMVTLVAVLNLLLSGERRLGIYVAATVIGGAIGSTLLKLVFDRPRPDIPGAPHVFTASFPSGHATLSAVVFLTLAAVLSAATPRRSLKIFYLAIGIALTVLVGVSRLYLGSTIRATSRPAGCSARPGRCSAGWARVSGCATPTL